MMHLWPCDKRRFVDFIADRRPLVGADVQKADTVKGVSLHGDELLLVWSDSPADTFILPHAVIVAEGSISNFLAWVLTYFRHIRPFTAHCRVLTPSLAHLSTQPIPPPSLQNKGSADIGLTLAEGIAYSVGRTDLNRLPFSAFARTLSFAFAEGAKRYERFLAENGQVFEQIKSGWLSARELSNQPPLDLSPADICAVWTLTLNAFAGHGAAQSTSTSEQQILEALQGIRASGFIPRGTWIPLTSRFRKVASLIDEMEGPREGRVKAAEIAIKELASGPAETRRHRSFVAGYMTSRIQPGSLDHFPVLFPVISELRESLLWYGACSGLSPETSVDDYGNGLGLLIKRELGRPSHWLDRPNCDIALSEMDTLLRHRNGAKPTLQTLSSGILKVEIFPLIFTSVKWSEYGEDHIPVGDKFAPRQRTMLDDEAGLRQDVFELLRRIEDSTTSLNAIRKQVETKFGQKVPKGRKPQK